MEISALFMLCGVSTTLLIPETKGKTLDELAGEMPGTSNYDPVSSGHAYKSSGHDADLGKIVEGGKVHV